MTQPLLDLETLIRRPTVAIDGVSYELLSADELSVLDSHRFHLWGRRLEQLQQGDVEDPEMQDLIDTIARRVLVDVPEDVFAKLTGIHKIAVAEVFTALLLRSRMAVAGATSKVIGENLLTGVSSFPGFSGSMGAPRVSGWKKYLSRLFGLI